MARPKNLHLLTGRPSKFTMEKAQTVLERVAAGEALTAICREPGMPSASTVLYWGEPQPLFPNVLFNRHSPYGGP